MVKGKKVEFLCFYGTEMSCMERKIGVQSRAKMDSENDGLEEAGKLHAARVSLWTRELD